MLRIFRSFRQRLLTENRVSKYLLYAVGEILLVVIGILLALQVNNWNELRKDRENERLIINSLRQEMQANKEYLSARLNSYFKNVNGCRNLLRLTGPDPPDLASDTFDSLVSAAVRTSVYNPASADLERIIGSEDFNLIRNDSLKSALRKYTVLLNFLHDHENWRAANARDFSDREQLGYNSTTIINYGQRMGWEELKGLEKSRFHFDSARWLSDPIFEKDIANLLQILHYTKNRTIDVLEQLDAVQDLINQYPPSDNAPLLQKDSD